MSAPPADLPKREPRPQWTTEAYRRWVYTPSVEYQVTPGVTVADPTQHFSGKANGSLVVQSMQVNGETVPETVLVIGGVSQ